MPDYYLYLFDRQGRITKRLEFTDCADDDAARDRAEARQHDEMMELWCGGRLVETYLPWTLRKR